METWIGSPSARAHPVHGPEDERDAERDGEARGVVVGRAPVRARVLRQQAPQLRPHAARVPGNAAGIIGFKGVQGNTTRA